MSLQADQLRSVVRLLREEIALLQDPSSHIGEVIKPMGKKKVLVKVNPDGKYVVDLDKSIDINSLTPNTRVALRNDSYVLHKILPNKVDPLVGLMKVEKVPDSTYDMVGGLSKQIKEIKEVRRRVGACFLQFCFRSLSCPSSIPSCSRRSASRSPRACCSTALLALVRSDRP
jgi:26S proteasome regulatory subunit T6